MKVFKMNMQMRLPKRLAATILEVLFATIVIVIGLLGIATLIPFAARDAQTANNHNQAVSLGLAWAESFFARGLHNTNANSSEEDFKWIWFRDYSNVALTPDPRWEYFSRTGFGGANALRVNGAPIATQSPSFSGATTQSLRIWGHEPVCIDPFLFTAKSTIDRLNSEIASSSGSSKPVWYRASVFPYFNDCYDPATDPYNSSSTGFSIDMPRMLRVGLGFTPVPSPPYPRSTHVSHQLVSNLFGSMDDVVENTYVEDDSTDTRAGRVDKDSLPPERLFITADGSPTGARMKSMLGRRYTWKATVVPEEPIPSEVSTVVLANDYAATPARNAIVSFLILHRHSSEFVQVGTPIPGSTDDKPTGERSVRVYPLSGNFINGAGGRVRLIGSGATKNTVEVGDWVMLGRNYLLDPVGRLYPYFRWYRIIGVDADVTEGELQTVRPTVPNDQFGSINQTEQVWARDVVLDGPDFAFGEFGPIAGVSTPTTGTLVTGVITVVERQVRLD